MIFLIKNNNLYITNIICLPKIFVQVSLLRIPIFELWGVPARSALCGPKRGMCQSGSGWLALPSLLVVKGHEMEGVTKLNKFN